MTTTASKTTYTSARADTLRPGDKVRIPINWSSTRMRTITIRTVTRIAPGRLQIAWSDTSWLYTRTDERFAAQVAR